MCSRRSGSLFDNSPVLLKATSLADMRGKKKQPDKNYTSSSGHERSSKRVRSLYKTRLSCRSIKQVKSVGEVIQNRFGKGDRREGRRYEGGIKEKKEHVEDDKFAQSVS